MADRALLETSTRTWSDLFGNGKRYTVPRFQRDYAWGIDEWADLWQDILELKDAHYMGTVVLKAEPDGRWTVIDGQQRLATLSILALAVIGEIQSLATQGISPSENGERVRILRDHLISSKDAASLKEQSRLTLNDSDNGFFQTRLVQLAAPPNTSRLKGSEKKMWEAFEYFQRKVRERFPAPGDGAELATFLQDYVAKSLLFIEIKVHDDLSAYTVFETLNARGLELTTTDLLKNYMFSLAAQSESDLALAQDQWHRLIRRIEMARFPDFLYHYIVSLGHEATKKHRLFAQVRGLIKTREDVFRWLDKLEEAADVYIALSDANDPLWTGDKMSEDCVRELTLFGVDQFKALVLATRRSEKREIELSKVLRLCVVLTMRATIVGHRNTADVLRAYQAAIKAVVEGRATSTKGIFAAVQGLYPSDEEFVNQFETIAIPTSGPRKKLVKYILCSLEPSFGGTELSFETSPLTIEHILPENPNDDWSSFGGEDRDRFVYRLGNLTLLEPSLNREAGSTGYEQKRAVYARSASKMTAAIDAPDWNPVAVRERQRVLARAAAQRWRLDY